VAPRRRRRAPCAPWDVRHGVRACVRGRKQLYALALEGKSTRLFPANRVAGDGVGFPPRRRTVVCQFYTELDAFNGHWELALEHLDSAVAHGLQDTFWMDRCPTLDELRGSARFESLRSIVRVRAERALATLDEVRPPKG
jgi:serine/threonine-protein kinase